MTMISLFTAVAAGLLAGSLGRVLNRRLPWMFAVAIAMICAITGDLAALLADAGEASTAREAVRQLLFAAVGVAVMAGRIRREATPVVASRVRQPR